MSRKFLYEVCRPLQEFGKRAHLNLCVPTYASDVEPLGVTAAIAAYHHWEAATRKDAKAKVPEMRSPRGEELRLLLKDISDTAKHGKLTKEDRQVTFETALAFEFDENNRFRFLRTVLLAKNGRTDGAWIDVADTIFEYLDHLIVELGYDVNVIRDQANDGEFQENAITYFTPMALIEVPNTRLRFYRRDENGNLILANPPEIRFAVLDAVASPQRSHH